MPNGISRMPAPIAGTRSIASSLAVGLRFGAPDFILQNLASGGPPPEHFRSPPQRRSPGSSMLDPYGPSAKSAVSGLECENENSRNTPSNMLCGVKNTFGPFSDQ